MFIMEFNIQKLISQLKPHRKGNNVFLNATNCTLFTYLVAFTWDDTVNKYAAHCIVQKILQILQIIVNFQLNKLKFIWEINLKS